MTPHDEKDPRKILYFPWRISKTTYECPACKAHLHIEPDLSALEEMKRYYQDLILKIQKEFLI